ncbi:hypothetical protein RB195_013043 [Necator americanus]|uniref:Uncharacterized protein n=1 Tax=Necator americanus TaxID=51031 RepID=A0ABR1DTU0_NECAM
MSHPQRHSFNTTPNAVNALYNNNSLLNFVDASILNKMELPTFDGKLLDFPEFASRVATFVGNKAEDYRFESCRVVDIIMQERQR